jgi:hypothetical protein
LARFHLATITPTKAELIAAWAPTQPWGLAADVPIEVIGSYRFDEPDGRVGMEAHLVTAGGTLLNIPLTYRDEPLEGADDALIVEMQHSVLGTRWVYDGLRDPRLVIMLAAVAMTGQGEALGMAVYDGRWYIAPSNVRIQGGGWTQERVPVDGFEVGHEDATSAVLHNDRFELRVFRRPVVGPRPAIGLTATWDGHPDPVVLAAVTERPTLRSGNEPSVTPRWKRPGEDASRLVRSPAQPVEVVLVLGGAALPPADRRRARRPCTGAGDVDVRGVNRPPDALWPIVWGHEAGSRRCLVVSRDPARGRTCASRWRR